jgi:quercetin dioxygenase-like cupin family protein
MARTVRRIVTGLDGDGRPAVLQEEQLTAVLGDGTSSGLWPIWGVNGTPVVPTSSPASVFEPFFPLVGGFRCFVQQIPPGSVPMHVTPTVDVILILEGELWLELDQDGGEHRLGPGDFLIQNGTRHAWHNRSEQACLAVGIALGAGAT